VLTVITRRKWLMTLVKFAQQRCQAKKALARRRI
jgi:hypothetical protein